MPTTDPDRVVVPLDDVECRALLLGGRVGRLAFTRNALPAIQPFPYRFHNGEVVILTVLDSPYVPRSWGGVVAFQVDAFDGETPAGWSVTVVGLTRAVDSPAETAVLDGLPWAPLMPTRVRRYVAVRAELLSGWRTEPRAA
jgi:uncharacterized protein